MSSFAASGSAFGASAAAFAGSFAASSAAGVSALHRWPVNRGIAASDLPGGRRSSAGVSPVKTPTKLPAVCEPLRKYFLESTLTKELKCRQDLPAGAAFGAVGAGLEGVALSALSLSAAAAAAASSGETMAMIFFGGTGRGFRSCSCRG